MKKIKKEVVCGPGLCDPVSQLWERGLPLQTPATPNLEPGRVQLAWDSCVCWSLSDQVLLDVDVAQY
jgi:hypothetical protein